jgi:hypothetical protein
MIYHSTDDGEDEKKNFFASPLRKVEAAAVIIPIPHFPFKSNLKIRANITSSRRKEMFEIYCRNIFIERHVRKLRHLQSQDEGKLLLTSAECENN